MSGKTCSLQIYIASFNSSNQPNIPHRELAIKNYLLTNFRKLYDVSFSKSNKVEMQYILIFLILVKENESNAMRAGGIYGEIHNINLYYYYCQETIVDSAKFVRANVPSTGTKPVVASCINNATSKLNGSSFKAWCWFNGTWNFPKDAKCFCKRGYEALETGCICK